MISDNPEPVRKRPWLRALVVLALLLVAAGIIWGFVYGQQEVTREAEREAPVAAPLRITRGPDGQTIVALDAATRQRNGIVVAAAAAAGSGEQLTGFATVVDVAPLADMSGTLATTRAQAAAAAARVVASKTAAARAHTLYQDEQIGSLATAQAAEATYRADVASSTAASSAASVQATLAAQTWGPVIGEALVRGDALITRLLARQSVLVQVTLPPGAARATPPTKATVAGPNGDKLSLQLLSAATRADPRVQGAGYYYLAPSAPGLVPGISLSIALVGRVGNTPGAAVPPEAVVAAGGRTWVYAQVAPDQFARREVATDGSSAVASGGQRAVGVAPGTPIVVRGAQALLSEEFRAAVKVGQDG